MARYPVTVYPRGATPEGQELAAILAYAKQLAVKYTKPTPHKVDYAALANLTLAVEAFEHRTGTEIVLQLVKL